MTAIDITGMARHPAGTCDACGHDAVELLVTRESDEITDTGTITLRYCRACCDANEDDAWNDPDAEIIIGEPVDAIPISRTCVRCGQLTLTSADPLCEPCKARAREPQGDAMRLFTPAPNAIPGQLTL